MSGCNYLDYENDLQKELTKDDCPFVHIGDDWQILSASEVYKYCAHIDDDSTYKFISNIISFSFSYFLNCFN